MFQWKSSFLKITSHILSLSDHSGVHDLSSTLYARNSGILPRRDASEAFCALIFSDLEPKDLRPRGFPSHDVIILVSAKRREGIQRTIGASR
jgi:hypothetical protein